MEQKRSLVKLEDLYKDNAIEVVHKQNELNALLNQPPKKEWLQEHPTARGVIYLPIERVEFLLTAIFSRWRFEVKVVQTIANSVVVTGRLHVQNPLTLEWDWQDGVGAAVIQTEKGAGALDFDKVNSMAVMKAAPAAESFAIKDAAEKFGKIFGKDLNRKHSSDYSFLADKYAGKAEELELRLRISNLIAENQDKEQIQPIISEITEAEQMGAATVDFYKRMVKKLENGN